MLLRLVLHRIGSTADWRTSFAGIKSSFHQKQKTWQTDCSHLSSCLLFACRNGWFCNLYKCFYSGSNGNDFELEFYFFVYLFLIALVWDSRHQNSPSLELGIEGFQVYSSLWGVYSFRENCASLRQSEWVWELWKFT